MLTWEWNIYQECCDWWFQSVDHGLYSLGLCNAKLTKNWSVSEDVLGDRKGGIQIKWIGQTLCRMWQYRSDRCLWKDGNETKQRCCLWRWFLLLPLQVKVDYIKKRGELKLDASLKTELADINSAGEIIDFLGHSSSIYNY